MRLYPNFKDIVERNVEKGLYTEDLLNDYTDKEYEKLDSYLRHSRDYEFTYAGLQQVVDKYLIQDRSTGTLFETPQFMYMLIAMTLFRNYDRDVRLAYIKKYYDATSQFKINIPTPIMAGVRTPLKQFASCVLVDSDDTLDSLFIRYGDWSICCPKGRYWYQRRKS